MGSGASSTAATQRELGKSEKEIVKLMMPIYYDPVDITPEQHKLAEDCWKLVLSDSTPEFLAKKGTEGFNYQSCVTFFYDNFYVRLFDCHPAAKELFKSGMKGQGKFLVMMLSLALSEMTKPGQFDKTLIKLAEIHYHRGVKAVEYGIMGDVLFWTLRKVMGDANYTRDLHVAWVKVYSRMLRTIIPCAVKHELGAAEVADGKREMMTGMFNTAQVIKVNCQADDHLASQKVINTAKAEKEASIRVASAV